MKTETVWAEKIPGKDHMRSSVHSLAFSPDGTQVLVAVGLRVLVYDANDGDLLHSLRGHRDCVYAVAYSKDGKRFASGGADHTIIIWTHKCEGILKYMHKDSIQCLSYNPVTQQLASATASDFGYWSPEQKSVAKFPVSSRVLCCDWTPDGAYLALGQMNGQVSIRDRQGNEKTRITRDQPVWTLKWRPSSGDGAGDQLAVGCWDETLTFHDLLQDAEITQVGEDVKLGYDPCSLSFYDGGRYLLVGGSDHKVNLYTTDGIFLKTLVEFEDWVWTLESRPTQKYVAVGTNDGSVGMYQTTFSTVHGLYQDRYAHRDSLMTDVMVQHLITEQKVRIKCKEYVKKIAVYRSRLAVQLPSRVHVYETMAKDPYDMNYKTIEKVKRSLECNLLVVTNDHITLCQEKKLQLYSFKGVKLREWVVESVIRYIRVVGGPPGREGLLVGLRSGAVYKIFVDNQFPILLCEHEKPVRCLDLSSSRKKLALVDEQSKVFIYDLVTKEKLYEEANANSVAWNADMEEMFCYSGGGQLSIKTGGFPISKQPLLGFVVGFKGSKIFCLHYLAMQTIDVPQSASLFRYLQKKDYENAYAVACLGVTTKDWRDLAMAALHGLHFGVARKAFIRVRDIRYIELLNRIEVAHKAPGHDDSVLLADIYAFQGKYNEAARLYLRRHQRRKAIEMYLDLRDWERAKELVEGLSAEDGDAKTGYGVSMSELLKKQALWLVETNELKTAAEIYWAAKDYATAIALYGDHGWTEDLMIKARTLHKSHKKVLALACKYFRKFGMLQYAKELYEKMEDTQSLIALLIEQRLWDEAFALAKEYPAFIKEIYLPYAEWLAINDRFEEARNAFAMAGKPDESLKMLEALTYNAIVEHRYQDAGYDFWLLALTGIQEWHDSFNVAKQAEFARAQAALNRADARSKAKARARSRSETKGNDDEEDGEADSKESKSKRGQVGFSVPTREELNQFHQTKAKGELYYAYHRIYRFTEVPFSLLSQERLFQTAQFVLNNLQDHAKAGHSTPRGISRAYALHVLAEQGRELGAYKAARHAYNALLTLRVPREWRESIETNHLVIRTKPFSDREELAPSCYRCSSPNPLLNEDGDVCTTCKHRFVRNFGSFDVLPLVRFYLASGVSHEAAMKAIAETDSAISSNNKLARMQREREEEDGHADRMMIGGDSDDDDAVGRGGGGHDDDDLFGSMLAQDPGLDGSFPPLKCAVTVLRQMKKHTVFVRRWGDSYEYYKNVIDEMPVIMCDKCQHFFSEEDFETHALVHQNCPFCRSVQSDFVEEKPDDLDNSRSMY